MPCDICPHCGGDIVLCRQINGNGAQVIVARCCRCDRIPNRKQPFLPKADYPHWESFPLYQDNMDKWHKVTKTGKFTKKEG